MAVAGIVGAIIGRLRHTCKPNLVESRWIEVHQKQNKAPELFMEAKGRCDCGETLMSYFTPKQLGYGPEGTVQ